LWASQDETRVMEVYYSDDDSKVVVALPAWVFVDLLPQ
jgi:hypothetical protein